MSAICNICLFIRELLDYKRLFSDKNRLNRRVVFYSERDIYWQYYEGYIRYIVENSDLEVCYITSDPEDPVLRGSNRRIHPFFIRHLIAATIRYIDSCVLVMTMPDLNRYHVKRSIHAVNHVYLFHGIGSVHLQYNKGAFDAYDTVFCIGPYDENELRKSEELYKTQQKKLVQCGYYRIERIFRDYREELSLKDTIEHPIILIAPSWHKGNILESCIDGIIDAFEKTMYEVIIRPHPEFIKRQPKRIKKIAGRLKGSEQIRLELDMVSADSILNADVLVTDWSAISFEYAFGTERPVLFINTPCRINNPDYSELGIEPIEFTLRDLIGQSIDIDDVSRLPEIVEVFLQKRRDYQDRIIKVRRDTLYHWLESEKMGGDYLIKYCLDKISGLTHGSERATT
jgi:YidC/Oxa1 family membrane protein insertase